MMTPAEHNDAKWLDVTYEENGRGQGFLAGWYVIRTCPCHWRERVTLPQESEAEAQRVRRVILGVEPARRRDQTPEWSPTPPRPAAVLRGQVWRRNRHRNGRYFQVLAVNRRQAVVRSVERTEDGHWAGATDGVKRPILLRRMLCRGTPTRTAAWPYTLVEEEAQ